MGSDLIIKQTPNFFFHKAHQYWDDNPGVCHNISLDIRYALFLIDKFAGAGYLVDEMNIVQ